MQGRAANEVPFAIEVAGGRKGAAPFFLELVGDAGTLRLEGGAPRGLQSGRFALLRDGEPLAVAEGELAALPDAAANIGGLYVALRNDIANGTRTVDGFGHAARLTRTIEAVLRSAGEGWVICPKDQPLREPTDSAAAPRHEGGKT